MEKTVKYKVTKPRLDTYQNVMVRHVLRKGKILWFIPFWYYDHQVQDFGQAHADELMYLLNNPAVFEARLIIALKSLSDEQ